MLRVNCFLPPHHNGHGECTAPFHKGKCLDRGMCCSFLSTGALQSWSYCSDIWDTWSNINTRVSLFLLTLIFWFLWESRKWGKQIRLQPQGYFWFQKCATCINGSDAIWDASHNFLLYFPGYWEKMNFKESVWYVEGIDVASTDRTVANIRRCVDSGYTGWHCKEDVQRKAGVWKDVWSRVWSSTGSEEMA